MSAKDDKAKVAPAEAGTKKKCIHEGHRARLVDLACNVGIENLTNIQVMELFLSYIFPRGDTNPLAHRLLDKFETLAHTVEAGYGDLKSVYGINDRSAKLIQLFSEFFYYFSSERLGKKFKVETRGDMFDLAEEHLRLRTTESMFLFALSPSKILTHKRRLSRDSESEVGISMIELGNFISSAKPTSLIIAHGHPYGDAKPSDADCKAFEKISQFCVSCGVDLVDSLIVGDNGVFSHRDNKMVRVYCDVDRLQDTLITLAGRKD